MTTPAPAPSPSKHTQSDHGFSGFNPQTLIQPKLSFQNVQQAEESSTCQQQQSFVRKRQDLSQDAKPVNTRSLPVKIYKAKFFDPSYTFHKQKCFKWEKDFNFLCLWFRASLIYINNCQTRCNTKQSIYYSASSLYMFRVSTIPIVRSIQNCNYSLRYWSYFWGQLPRSNVAK